MSVDDCIIHDRKSSTDKSIRQAEGQAPPTVARLANESQAESVEVMMPMMRDHFIDAKVCLKRHIPANLS